MRSRRREIVAMKRLSASPPLISRRATFRHSERDEDARSDRLVAVEIVSSKASSAMMLGTA